MSTTSPGSRAAGNALAVANLPAPTHVPEAAGKCGEEFEFFAVAGIHPSFAKSLKPKHVGRFPYEKETGVLRGVRSVSISRGRRTVSNSPGPLVAPRRFNYLMLSV